MGVAIGLAWALRLARTLDAQRKELMDERRELQYWDLTVSGDGYYSSQRLHFPNLLLRESSASGDITFTLYDVRRKPDGVWERCLHDGASVLMHRRYRRIMGRLAHDEHTRDREFDADAKTVRHFASLEIEIAYQRFIHAQDVPIVDAETIIEAWEKEADEAEQRERKREERESAPKDAAETKSA
ncbi:MAG TPA: hypothetical protein VI456_07210 [Polyangia bacterium]